jgi:hypothetical protein
MKNTAKEEQWDWNTGPSNYKANAFLFLFLAALGFEIRLS